MATNAKARPEVVASSPDESASGDYQPLQPAEVKLIVWSLILGAVLMGILILVSYTFF